MINPGIKAALNPTAFQGGPFTIHWYGVIIASGVVLALLLAVREGKREGIPEDDFYDYLLWALPIAIICARIYYVVFQWSYYSQHPSEIIAIWDGGIAIYGAILGGFIVLLVFVPQSGLSLRLSLGSSAFAEHLVYRQIRCQS